jgi:hypothetical protein
MDSNQTKGCVTFILVLAVILAIAAAAVAYYFYSIGDLTIPGFTQQKQSCGCFYTSSDSSCNSPTGALIFKVGQTDDNGKCVASCPTPSNDPKLNGLSCEYKGKPINGSCSQTCGTGFESRSVTGADSSDKFCLCCKSAPLKACNQINLKEDISCTNLTVTTSSDEILTPPIDPQFPIKISATFNEDIEYTEFVFKVNGIEVPADKTIPGDCTENCIKEDGKYKPYVIIDPSDYITDSSISLQISAEGINDTKKSYDKTPCSRTYLLVREEAPNCGSVSFITKEANDKFNTEAVSIRVNALPSSYDNLKVKFTFKPAQSSITTLTTKDASTLLNGKDILFKLENINSASTFAENTAFPILDPESRVQVDVIYDAEGVIETLACGDTEIDRATSSGADGKDGEDDDDPVVDSGTTPPTGATSNFTVAKTGPQCVERVNPLNISRFVINIANRNSAPDLLENVIDKLPLGFTYQTGSTRINGVNRADAGTVTLETTGNSQEITWSQTDGWPIDANGSMVIEFTAIAGPQAITGQNLNEVLLTPINTPTTPSNLRASFTFNVAQTCSTPRTGLFDDTLSKVFAGVAVLIIGLLFSVTSAGERMSLKLANSNIMNSLNSGMSELKSELFTPKYSFEKKVLNEAKRKNKNKSKN